MARIRSVHPDMATDEAYMSMSFPCKAAWPLLWTECDDHGVFDWKPLGLKARIFPNDAINFADILNELEALGCLKKIEIGGKPYGLVRNFCKFQKPKFPTYRIDITPEHLEYSGATQKDYVSPTPVLPQSYPSPPHGVGVGVGVGVEGSSLRSELTVRADKRELQKLADEFYDAYPKKVDPPNAKQKFVKLCKSGIDPKLIIDAARRFAAAHQLSGTEKQFIPAPAVWLNKGGYASEDLPAPARAGPDGNQLNGQQNQRQTGNSPLRGNHHAKPKTSVDYARELAEHFNPGLNTSGGSVAAMWDGPSLDLWAEADSIFPASGRA